MTEQLFDFAFVDRTNERKIISNFINGKVDKNILWINGSSGVGKSFLLQNTIISDDSCTNIFISPQAQARVDNALKLIISEIQSSTKISFIDFLKSNYTSISDIAKKIVTRILSYHNVNIDWFFEMAFDSSKLFVNNDNELQSSTKIIERYIETVLSEGNKLMFVLDNFTYCDYKSQIILIDILKRYMSNDKILFIVATTQEQLENQDYLKKVLLEQLNTEKIFLKGFPDEQCFKQIIENRFVMSTELNELITYIYKVCKGIPESLKEIFRNMVLSDSIEKNSFNKKAVLNVDKLKDYLYNSEINDLPQIDFRLINDMESFFLQTITYIKYPISQEVLSDILDYLYAKLICPVESSPPFPTVSFTNKYIGIDVLKNQRENNISFISFKHDLLYYKLTEHFSRYVNKEQIFYYLYQYVESHHDFLKTNGFNNDDLQAIKAYYSYQANIEEWIDLNFELGLKKYNDSLFYEAIDVFQRLTGELQNLEESKKLDVAKCYYDAGEYAQCIWILNSIEEEFLNENERYILYLEWGKALYIKLNATEAIKKLDSALEYANTDEKYYNTLAMKLTALAETSSGGKKAQHIFESEIKELIEQPIVEKLGNVFRNCWAYCINEDSIKYLNIALEIAKRDNNVIDTAYTYNNLGREYVRTWQLDDAAYVYKKAYELLDNTKKHETSYPLNNLAVLEMLNKKYQNAMDYLLEANLWNRSPYMQNAIKSHMLMCNYYLGNSDLCEKISNELYQRIFGNDMQDPNIIRKVSINLCIYYRNIGNLSKAKECIKLAYPHLRGSNCEYRGLSLYNEIMQANESLEDLTFTSTFYKIMDFEPWTTTLSHQ